MSTNSTSNSTFNGTAKPNKLIFAPGEHPPDSGQPTSSTTSDAANNNTPSQQAAQFSIGTLTRRDLDTNPFTQFNTWFTHPALRTTVPETVTLSTASLPSGRVSSRTVYLKELDSRGWVVYSNWGTSRKAADVASNTHAALCFWWKPLERQVRIEGRCERLTAAESQVYFDTRARGSRIGAWASRQSVVLKPEEGMASGDGEVDDGRKVLERQVGEIAERFEGTDKIPVPEFWGGLRVVPDMVEFWQGRDSRLHDRFRYTREGESEMWKIERLSP